jgi:hypothetical protein
MEVTARENLGLGVPGETELLVPNDVAMAYTVSQPSTGAATFVAPRQAAWQRHFEAWMNFFLHRDPSTPESRNPPHLVTQ